MSGLVCLLPHGYEGQGPEHSSARLERFLQLYAKDNLQVLYPSTPASYFHALRRQLHRPFRKPLIVMTPKSLLRHKLCTSSLEEMGPGSSFHRVMYERPPSQADRDVTRVVLCSGKVYYDLVQRRQELGLEDVVSLVRLEQLAPFPDDVLAEELVRYPKRVEVIWCQEEPQNMGAWSFVAPRIEAVLERIGMRQTRPTYAGRPAAASPATGLYQQHVREQTSLVEAALTGEPAEAVGTAAERDRQRSGRRRGEERTGSRGGAMSVEIRVPSLGESVTEATVAKWFKQVGDAVNADEPIVELETDKVTLEFNAPASGTLAEIAVEEGGEVEVGALLGSISQEAGAAGPAAKPAAPKAAEEGATAEPEGGDGRGNGALSPAVRKLLEEHDLDPATIAATGPKGNLTKGDVLQAVEAKLRGKPAPAERAATPAAACPRHARGRGGRGGRARARGGPAARTSDHRATTRGRCDAPARRLRRASGGGRAGGVRAPGRRPAGRRARGAGQDDPAAAADRRAPQGGAEHRGHAHHLQRGRHERGDGAAPALSRQLREEARRAAGLHVVLRQGVDQRAPGVPRGQRRDRRRRDRLQASLRHRGRGRHALGAGRAGGP